MLRTVDRRKGTVMQARTQPKAVDTNNQARKFLSSAYEHTVAAVSVPECLPRHLPDISGYGRVIVVGAGKAAARAAQLIEDTYRDQGQLQMLSGHVAVPRGFSTPTERIQVSEAGWLADAGSLRAARDALAAARDAGPHDLVVCLMSSGAAALWAGPIAGISLAAQKILIGQLDACGARADEIDCVVKHLSQIMGGKLAIAAHPARVQTFVISNGTIDEAAEIGLGPTMVDSGTLQDAAEILARFRVGHSAEIAQALSNANNETLKSTAPAAASLSNAVIASCETMVSVASSFLSCAGYEVRHLDSAMGSDLRQMAAEHARQVRECSAAGARVAFIQSISRSQGLAPDAREMCGQAYLLALAIALRGCPEVTACAFSTDGIDGSSPGEPSPSAGALINQDTLARAADAGLDCEQMLNSGGARQLFVTIGDQIGNGPTHTDTGQLRIVLSEP